MFSYLTFWNIQLQLWLQTGNYFTEMKLLRDFTKKKVIILSQKTILDQMKKVNH